MTLLGIKFAPLFIPLHRRLETLAIAAAISTIFFGGILGTLFVAYLIFCTNYWQEALIYLFWIYVIDVNTSERGGRRSEWARGWLWWKYFKEYFPTHLYRVPSVELDPKRNYLFCFTPHSILPMGFFAAFGSRWGGFHELFPNHIPYLLTVNINFQLPILRELILSIGGCNASKNSLNWILGSPAGGKVAVLVIGGAAEVFNSRHAQYRILLKKRKGFVKIALKNGTPLVPVFSFGETSIYKQVEFAEGSIIRNIQEWTKTKTGIVLAIIRGRGLFQYTFGILPQRIPISTVVGKPIEVAKVDHPTQEQIDDLHAEFTKQLIELFEEQKYNYVSNPHKTRLIID